MRRFISSLPWAISSLYAKVSQSKQKPGGVRGNPIVAKRPGSASGRRRRERIFRVGPRIAIIGAPNVGKSTLFNRLVGRRAALVDDRPGVTRDRKENWGILGDLRFPLVDTGGIIIGGGAGSGPFDSRIYAHSIAALREADRVLFLVDGRAGLSCTDQDIAALLRREGVVITVCVNKCDLRNAAEVYDAAYSLGLGEPVALSAVHDIGMERLYRIFDAWAVQHDCSEAKAEPAQHDFSEAKAEPAQGNGAESMDENPARPLRIAVIGRPNVGKSTLINRLVGTERLITGPEPGITRDAVEVPICIQGQKLILVDTAGMRKKARIQEKLETLSVSAALSALRFCDVALLLIAADAEPELLGIQERRLAARIHNEKRGLVIGLNKCDQIADPEITAARLRETIEVEFPPARGAAVVALSALRDSDFTPILEAIETVHRRWNTRIGTGVLNRWLRARVERHPPAAISGRRPRLRYMAQIKTRPPSFIVFCSRLEGISASYLRYLEAGLREDFDFGGAAPQIILRVSDNPYAQGERKGRRISGNSARNR